MDSEHQKDGQIRDRDKLEQIPDILAVRRSGHLGHQGQHAVGSQCDDETHKMHDPILGNIDSALKRLTFFRRNRPQP